MAPKNMKEMHDRLRLTKRLRKRVFALNKLDLPSHNINNDRNMGKKNHMAQSWAQIYQGGTERRARLNQQEVMSIRDLTEGISKHIFPHKYFAQQAVN